MNANVSPTKLAPSLSNTPSLFGLGHYSGNGYFEQWPFRPIDIAFADLIHYLSDEPSDELALVCAYVSWQTGQQHSCVSFDELSRALASFLPKNWQSWLCAHPLVGNETQTDKPLIVSNDHVYLQRYWYYETQLNMHINRIEAQASSLDLVQLKICLDQAFERKACQQEADVAFDWQKNAVALCLLQRFCVISGGPGTGKTTTVARLIQSLQDYTQATRQTHLTIRLAAPTGKAAARLTYSLAESLNTNAQALFSPCVTLHHLMGVKGKNGAFVHHEDNPLHLDVLIIDEASMVDLALMAKVMAAVPPHASVVLLGDTNQLASVDVGNVLADICMAGHPLDYSDKIRQQLGELLGTKVPAEISPFNHTIDAQPGHKNPGNNKPKTNDRVAWLHKSYRFSSDSQIGQLARVFLSGKANEAIQLLSQNNTEELVWQASPNVNTLLATMYRELSPYFEWVNQGDINECLRTLSQFQVLAAHKNGPLGVNNINHKFELLLMHRGIIQDNLTPYPGKPVMVTRNASNLGLYNGDVGIFMPDPENLGMLKIWFLIEGAVKGFLPARVPQYDTAYCMTVHKSQGSEFDQVIVCLNEVQSNQSNLTRELLYTGLTRAKKRFQLFATTKTVAVSLGQQVKRASGLALRLFGDD